MAQPSPDDSPIERSDGSLTDKPNDSDGVVEKFESGENQKSPTSSPSPQYGHNIRSARVTDKYVFFWNGPLSNWNAGRPFSGRRAMDLLIDRLDRSQISRPSRTALSTVMMGRHEFNCGEQFMMACKGWLFETATIRGADLDTSTLAEDNGERICKAILGDGDDGTRKQGQGQRQQPVGHERVQQSKPDQRKSNTTINKNTRNKKSSSSLSSSSTTKKDRRGIDVDVDVETEIDIGIDHDGIAGGTLAACLLTPDPRLQKALGRRTRGFDEKVWKKASKAVAVAGSIARAEADEELRHVYLGAAGVECSNRNFVEGSPMDKVWGIGLRWDDPWADDETHWRGENRLGKCHDEAAEWLRQEYNK